MKIGELWNSSKSFGIQECDLIVREIQIKQVSHSLEGPAFDFVDFAELQIERHNLAGAWKAVGWDVMEVVSTEIEQLSSGGEASWYFAVTTALTCGMMGFSLGSEKKEVAGVLNHKDLLSPIRLFSSFLLHVFCLRLSSCSRKCFLPTVSSCLQPLIIELNHIFRVTYHSWCYSPILFQK